MRTVIAVAALAFGFATTAQADIIRCTFTEPFYSTTYSMAQQRLYVSTPDSNYSHNNVGFQIMSRGRFIIGDPANPMIRLNLNYRGSDGMSDFIYPYTATFRLPDGTHHTGGCESNFRRKRMRTSTAPVDPDAVIDSAQ